MRMFVLFAACTAFSPGGCSPPVSPPARPAGGGYVLIVQITAESVAQERTALPPSPVEYTISVSRGDESLGSVAHVSGTSFPVPLSAAPAAGDEVKVAGFDSAGNQYVEGDYTLTGSEETIAITLRLSTEGTGNMDLSVSLPNFTGDDAITAAELSLYRSLEDYQGENIYSFTRYRKDDTYGAGEILGSNIPIKFDNFPSGNYVAQIEFFRFKRVRVSRLAQTIIVRKGLTTKSWDGGDSTLNWGTDKFASSDTSLGGMTIEGGTITFSAGTTSYAIIRSRNTALAPSETMTINGGKPGQNITALLNETKVSKSGASSWDLPMEGANSIVIMVTAQDGVTQQTYTVSYTYVYSNTEWYVAEDGKSSNNGTSSTSPLETVAEALTKIKTAYTSDWPGKTGGNPVPARINISGTINESVTINGGDLPPILLAKDDKSNTIKGKLTLQSSAKVILGNGLVLNGGVYVGSHSSFVLNEGTISENAASSGNHYGVYISGGGSFTMNGGTIKENKAHDDDGCGVYVASGSFTMNGGTISANTAKSPGGGVYVGGSGAGNRIFTMNGGTISANTAKSLGGGVYVGGSGGTTSSFIMNGGTIRGNIADSGGGVYVGSLGGASAFTMNGGTISGHTADRGSGVYVGGAEAGNRIFTMNGGTISGNIASASSSNSGGGVYVGGSGGASAFAMSGGTISGNSAAGNGGGVYVAYGAGFTMSGGAISGNTVNYAADDKLDGGGGVYVDGSSGASTFTMSGGTISGNISGSAIKQLRGGGVFVSSSSSSNKSSSFIMTGGTISGNIATGAVEGDDGGGGVFVRERYSSFTMKGGTISGNAAKNSGGGGVNVTNYGRFAMTGGMISANIATGTGTGTAIGSGGGVLVKDTSTFEMSSGTISGNTAEANGGGVWAKGAFTMSGGTISGNTAKANGGGVYVEDDSLAMQDGAVITTDNDVYLTNGKKITIMPNLTGAPPVARITPQQYEPDTEILGGENKSLEDHHGKFAVTPKNGTEWTIDKSGYLQRQSSNE
jgi:hypothetical protein